MNTNKNFTDLVNLTDLDRKERLENRKIFENKFYDITNCERKNIKSKVFEFIKDSSNISNGCYSEVYCMDENHILKSTTCKAYYRFFKFCERIHKSKYIPDDVKRHFPIIYGHIKILNLDYYIIEMLHKQYEYSTEFEHSYEEPEYWFGKFSESFDKALELLSEEYEEPGELIQWDLHDENIAVRYVGDTEEYVILDPWC